MVEIASDRPLFKTILVEMAYSIIHLHNRVNKSRIAILLLCPEKLELGKHLRCLPRCDHRKLLAVVVIIIVLLCTSSVTKSIYKSLYSLNNWATYLGIQFEAETGRSSIFHNVPWCSVPTDSCGSDRINQILYREEGSRTFHDFPRGLRDLLQNVAQICIVYI
jgi:hypothetical protein